MTNNDDLALKTRKDFEAYYNETHALKATSQFKRFGYYVSPTMQKAWELWQAAQSSLLAERDADKKQIAELVSAIGSINHAKHHEMMIPGNDEPVYWQRKEWVEWILELSAGIKLEVGE